MRENKDNAGVRSSVPQEMPAVRMTIVGGRPPGCGKELGEIPRGVEVLVKKAHVDAEFRELLLSRRSAAAEAIGLVLDPAEARVLDLIPAAQLEAVIARSRVEPGKVPAFLGKAAAVMLVALGASAASAQIAATKGVRPIGPIPTTQGDQAAIDAPTATRLARAAGCLDRLRHAQAEPPRRSDCWTQARNVVPQLQKILADGKVKPETAKTVQAIIETLDPAVGSGAAAAQEFYKKVHGLVSQIEFGDQTAIDNASKAIAELGRAAVGPLEKTLKDDKWKAETQQTLKALATRLAKARTRSRPRNRCRNWSSTACPPTCLSSPRPWTAANFPFAVTPRRSCWTSARLSSQTCRRSSRKAMFRSPCRRDSNRLSALQRRPLPCTGIRAVPAGILVRPIITPVAPPATQPATAATGTVRNTPRADVESEC